MQILVIEERELSVHTLCASCSRVRRTSWCSHAAPKGQRACQ